MKDLPYSQDFDALEAEELSKPGPEFIASPTREQIAECIRRGLERRHQYSVPNYRDGWFTKKQAS